MSTRTPWQKATDFIPNGCQTMSKCPDRYVNGVYPKMLSRGNGSKVYDLDNNEYIDFIAGLGPILLGYRHPLVDTAVIKTIDQGQVLLSLPHERESELAELLWETIPCAQKSKFFKTGSDALTAAVKVCRAHTGKLNVAVCGYHGWHDWYTIANDKKAGIPQVLDTYVKKFKYNDLQNLEDIIKSGDYAAVVLEPTVYDEPKPGYLHDLIELAHSYGALVVFDEVVTGYRFGTAGAQDYFGAKPDLACFSKAMGNGYPIAALVGQREYMDVFERNDFFVSGTYGGDLIGITAALATITCIDQDMIVPQIWEMGNKLKDGFNDICKILNLSEVHCDGYAPRTFFKFPSTEHKALFWQETVKQGILFGYANFIMSAHSQADIDAALVASEDALRVVKTNWKNPKAALQGDTPIEVFRMVR